jgi:cbb3-type cytochrome oxidase cytochrome c subunit
MRVTPALLVIGGMIILWASFFGSVILPTVTIPDKRSELWRAPTRREQRGRALFIANGCTGCHTQYIRSQDWDPGAERIAQPGDYFMQAPHLLGSERTGPDLSQAGGQHPDDWHIAHFINPRYTRPRSLMPRFEYVGKREIQDLTAYIQSLGGKQADGRVARQDRWKRLAVAAYRSGTDANISWLHSHVPDVWRYMPNPYPPSAAALARGEKVYQDFCIGCHGPVGDGDTPAAQHIIPPPLNFTFLKRNLAQGKYIGGILYYQIMNGITGTAMPYFKYDLESAKIWDVSNYIAYNFIGYTDSHLPPRGVPSAYEAFPEKGEPRR